MTQQELLKSVRRRLSDAWPNLRQRLWEDEELIDDYANAARDRLFLICRNLLIDSTTPTDDTGLPVCRIPIVAGQASYPISPKIMEITRLKVASQALPVPKIMQAQLDASYRGWETDTSNFINAWCPDIDSDSIVFIPTPQVENTALLTVSRFPLKRLAIANPNIPLGFREEYHEDLIPGIIYHAFSKKDAEADREWPALAESFRQKFEARALEIRAEVHRRFTNVGTISPKRAFL